MSSTSTKRRAARQKITPAPAPEKSCEVCHTPGDDTTLKNFGDWVPYYLCIQTPDRECDKRAGIIRDEAIAEDEAAAEETVEATT